jgi:hypothetical protein
MATGITFFAVGVVFTITMPDNIALGITFLGLGVVFFSLAGSGANAAGSEAAPAVPVEQAEPEALAEPAVPAADAAPPSETAPSSTDESEAPPR